MPKAVTNKNIHIIKAVFYGENKGTFHSILPPHHIWLGLKMTFKCISHAFALIIISRIFA